MGMLVTLIGASVVVGISYIVDSSGTVRLVVSAVSIRGITWVIKKSIESMDREKAQIINFTGWSLAGISLVGLLVNCKKGIVPIVKDVGEAINTFSKIKEDLSEMSNGLADFLERITFWN